MPNSNKRLATGAVERDRRATSLPNESHFEPVTRRPTKFVSGPWGTIPLFGTLAAWAIAIPFVGWSRAYQTFDQFITVASFILLFLIQRSQNKGMLSLQVKLNELLAAAHRASRELINVEDRSASETYRAANGGTIGFACTSGLLHAASPESFAFSPETWRWRISLSWYAHSLLLLRFLKRVLQRSNRQCRAMQLIRRHAVERCDQIVGGQPAAPVQRPVDDQFGEHRPGRDGRPAAIGVILRRLDPIRLDLEEQDQERSPPGQPPHVQ